MEQYKIDIIKEKYGKILLVDISKEINETPSAVGSMVWRLRQKGYNLCSKLKNSKEANEKMKEKWKDPQYLKKMEKRDKKNSEFMKENNPMFNRQIFLKAHEKMKKRWQDQEVKAKVQAENHWNWEGGVSRIYSQRLKKENFEYICFQCQRKINIDIHHKDLNEKNNELSNLVPLCRGCHTDLHKLLKKYDSQSIVTLLS